MVKTAYSNLTPEKRKLYKKTRTIADRKKKLIQVSNIASKVFHEQLMDMETDDNHYKYVSKQLIMDAIRIHYIAVCDEYPNKADVIGKEIRSIFGNLASSTHSIDEAVKHSINEVKINYKPENTVHFSPPDLFILFI